MSAFKDQPTGTNASDDLKRLKEAIAVLEKRQAELTASVSKTKDEKTRVLAELQKAQPELKKLKGEQRSLEESHKKLKQSSADLDKRLAENRTNLQKREENLRVTERSLEKTSIDLKAATTKQTELAGENEKLTSDRDERRRDITILQKEHEALEAALGSLKKKIEDAEVQATESLALAEAREDQVRISEQRFHAAEKRRKEQEQRLEALAAREKQLEEAGIALHQARQEHAELILLNKQKGERQSELESLQQQCEQLRQEKEDISTKITHQRSVLLALNADVESREKTLQAKKEQVQASDELLTRITTKVGELEREHQRLEKENARLSALLANTAQVELRIEKLQRDEKDSEAKTTQAQLREVAITERVSALLAKEEGLQQSLQALAREATAHQEALNALKERVSAAETQTAAKIAALEELIASHRRLIAEKEERLTLLQEHWEDLDQRYSKLAAMPESDPKALEEWREIEKQKESFVARITPKGGILARPATRITVVPRGNG